ncbi:MAG: hypothetical protein QXK76_01990 [Candidatus Woesearchaeota archaeon]
MQGKKIGIISLMPDTGNTTIAINLGLAFLKLGKKVVVVDAEKNKNIIEHMSISDIKNVDYPLEYYNLVHNSGLKLVYDFKENFNLNTLSVFHDLLLIDMPKNESLEEIIPFIDEAIIIHTPEYSSKAVVDTKNILLKNKKTVLGVILNKSHEDSVNTIFNVPVLCKIPVHKKISSSYNIKKPLLQVYPNSFVSKKFFNIAKRFI